MLGHQLFEACSREEDASHNVQDEATTKEQVGREAVPSLLLKPSCPHPLRSTSRMICPEQMAKKR